ncbi:RnfH family protein [Thauera sp.]|uniref:RnfH family protein n=1 Tax=Thauera sp. TaxID=1905334 RepID=UPI0039E263F8
MATIRVEVAYALPQQQELIELRLEEGATVRNAVEASGVLLKYPDIELDKRNKLGIFGKLAKADTVLRDRDRVEIYRPLVADPKAVRKKRAEEGKVMTKGGGPAEEKSEIAAS